METPQCWEALSAATSKRLNPIKVMVGATAKGVMNRSMRPIKPIRNRSYKLSILDFLHLPENPIKTWKIEAIMMLPCTSRSRGPQTSSWTSS